MGIGDRTLVIGVKHRGHKKQTISPRQYHPSTRQHFVTDMIYKIYFLLQF